ncbi:FumA C-terminus/TtdB family hydratase beta subunit [Desulfovibrio sp. OttesenSCG-928-C14]|nr:FumA C-terminus/TtdB family hydratase beta subunit [Desulfovibrio sp. OttesenSCG-928-C14]
MSANHSANPIAVSAPLSREAALALRAGDAVLLSGTIYTARDAAHQRLAALLQRGDPWPFDPEGAVIYYSGPTPPPPGLVIGAAGPTTSYRMDSFAPSFYDLGVRATIGKGMRGPLVKEAIRRNGALYLAATGGAGALLSLCVKAARVLDFADLGPEAVHELVVENMPLLVANDAAGGELYARPDLGVLAALGD